MKLLAQEERLFKDFFLFEIFKVKLISIKAYSPQDIISLI